ncbi:MAG TPA: cytochrome c oxidase assembly protein [Candidatus Baltobacteraceae bacterium]|nr:cytochrome c oxidase assembly protein [Candidatus Baltobacteraceae bacterium]
MSVLRAPMLWLTGAALTAGIAVSPPLDRLADASFAWHMAQHVMLLYVVSLFVLLSRPLDLVAAIAPKSTTAAFVNAMRPLHVFAWPPLTLAAYIAVLWGTHFSGLYQLSLEHFWVHVCEHALYVAAGIAFWLPVLGTPPVRPIAYPARLLYLFVALPQGALLGMAIDGARTPLYAHYAALATNARALTDQHDAAATMWIAGGLIVFCAMLATLGAWAARENRPAHSDSTYAARSRTSRSVRTLG